MKNITFILAFLFVGVAASAKSVDADSYSPFRYGESFIFVEGGVEFSVYPNGEFDFYYNPQFAQSQIGAIPLPNRNISYNAGYDYGAFVQYDDFGAVIQIENVPVYYDYYGRIIQAGNVLMNYNSGGELIRLGNMHIRYNRFNQPIKYVGYINSYNRRYVYRPWHQYYVRPHHSYSIVHYEPYRAYYEPARVDYFNYMNYYQNNNIYINRNDFYRPGQQVASYNHGRRTEVKREVEPATRSNYNSTRTEVETTSIAGTRSNNSTTYDNDRGRIESTGDSRGSNRSSVEISNMERHEAAVRAQRGATVNSAIERTSELNSRRNAVRENTYNRSKRTSAVQERQIKQRRTRAAVESRRSEVQPNNVPVRSSRIEQVQNTPSRAAVRSSGSARPSAQVKAKIRNSSEGRSGSRGRG